MFLLIDRCINALVRMYRKAVFKRKAHIKHNNFKMVGKVNVLSSNLHLDIGNNVTLYDGVTFWGDGPITIGDSTSIGFRSTICSLSEGGVTIGKNVLIAADCYIIDADHQVKKDVLIRSQEQITAPITIGDDVWIAQNVTVLKGTTIQDGAVIGAKALVKGEIPKNAICVGIPSKIIKYRD